MWADYIEVREQGIKSDIMAVNDVGMYCQIPLQHWVSHHTANLVLWRKLLHNHAMDFNGLMHANDNKGQADHVIDWHMNNPGAYSGLFAAQVGLCLGYQQIILCGVPQDDSGRFFDPPWVTKLTHGSDQTSKRSFKQTVQSNPEFKRCVRSMSGWTRELLGGSFDEVLDGQLQRVS